MSRFVVRLCFCIISFSVFGAESAITPRPSIYFITDYLPPAIYDGDTVTACFRIENATSTKTEFEVTESTTNNGGGDYETHVEKVTVAPNSVGTVKFEFQSLFHGLKMSRITFELHKVGDSKNLGYQTISLVRESDPWPETKVENGRLQDGRGIVIPVVEKKRAVEVREFAPMKWIFGSSKDTSSAHAGTCAAFAPAAWQLKIDAAKPLGPWPLNGSIPILNAMNQIVSDIAKSPPGTFKRAVILLPPEDLELATDPRTYRVVLDALLARLAKFQIGRIALIAPFKYGCNAAHRKAIWREIHESATVNAALVLDPLDWMHDAQWRVDPAAPNVFGRSPNAAGRKMIEQAISDLIR